MRFPAPPKKSGGYRESAPKAGDDGAARPKIVPSRKVVAKRAEPPPEATPSPKRTPKNATPVAKSWDLSEPDRTYQPRRQLSWRQMLLIGALVAVFVLVKRLIS